MYSLANLLWTIVVILVILWLLGILLNFTVGGLLHVLLVIAIIVIIVNLLTGRRVV